VLITGFAPFGGETTNPSWRVAQRVADVPLRLRDGRHVEITARELPIAPRVAFDVLWPMWEHGTYDRWLGLGQAGGRDALCVERVARNELRYRSLAGNAAEGCIDADEGASRTAALVDGDAAEVCVSAPIERLIGAIAAARAPVRASDCAGAFLCNQVLYVMESRLRARGSAGCAAFVHLPYLPEQVLDKPAGTPAVALDIQVTAVCAALLTFCAP
jgi:pyroglutamyl-peptidase